jgi:hypothetical protein
MESPQNGIILSESDNCDAEQRSAGIVGTDNILGKISLVLNKTTKFWSRTSYHTYSL